MANDVEYTPHYMQDFNFSNVIVIDFLVLWFSLHREF